MCCDAQIDYLVSLGLKSDEVCNMASISVVLLGLNPDTRLKPVVAYLKQRGVPGKNKIGGCSVLGVMYLLEASTGGGGLGPGRGVAEWCRQCDGGGAAQAGDWSRRRVCSEWSKAISQVQEGLGCVGFLLPRMLGLILDPPHSRR